MRHNEFYLFLFYIFWAAFVSSIVFAFAVDALDTIGARVTRLRVGL